jgi:hypothetical protein
MNRKLLLACCAAALFAIPIPAQAVVIDAFSEDLPPNPDLPVAGYTMLFIGSRCDGGSCPPGTIVTHTGTDVAVQSGLAGVLGGNRKTTLTEVSGSCNVNIIGSFNALTFNHDAGATKGILDLDYGETQDLNADLDAFAATGIEFEISGDGDDSNPVRPIICTITVTSARGTGSETTASAQQTLIADGNYLFPFTSFSGVDFNDVDRIQIRFDTSQQFGAIDFAVFTISTDEQPTPVETTSWGAIKALHD